MARSFLGAVVRDLERTSRAAARQRALQVQAQMRSFREAERARKAYERALASETKERQRLYAESRTAEVESKNEALEQSIADLAELLVSSLGKDTRIDFDSLLVTASVPELDLGALATARTPPDRRAYMPAKPHWSVGWLPWVRKSHEARCNEANRMFVYQMAQHAKAETERLRAIEHKREEHETQVQALRDEADKRNAEIQRIRTSFEAAEPEAVVFYFTLTLSKSTYTEGFPQQAKVLYIAESRQLLVEYDLPGMDEVVPAIKIYKYVKADDRIVETARPEGQRRTLYTSVVAQTVLRSLNEVFGADTRYYVDSIVFNGYVSAIDPGTGHRVRPCLVTVRTTKDVFQALDLRHVEATACLRTLNASLSKSPAELAPVRPILEFNMVDPRFIQEADVLSTLDQRPNLMDLTPGEFESLITNLFEKMGLETRQTQASRDGGVDCVAYDPRPIFGGKVVIQAKRYKNHVGVSAVRDLFGTMQNEGASKGILVTTSGYGKASFEFASGKPIELLSGSNLLYLLKEHAGIDAKIVVPDEWKDPGPDAS